MALIDESHAFALRYILSDEPIGVLASSTLPGVIRRGEVEPGARGCFDGLADISGTEEAPVVQEQSA